jgi:RNA polymerase sigma factor (sigma-70 family)
MERLPKITDEQLLEDFMSGSRESLNTLIKRHKGAVQAYILRTTRNKDVTEDIFQDTFIKVVHNLEIKRYRENGKFLPWVMRISHNLIIDYYRANKRPHVLSDDYDYDILANHAFLADNREEAIIDDQTKKALRKRVEQLPKEQRDIVQMRYFWGLSYKEIAQQTDVSINTSLGRMRYALINLRKMMMTPEK